MVRTVALVGAQPPGTTRLTPRQTANLRQRVAAGLTAGLAGREEIRFIPGKAGAQFGIAVEVARAGHVPVADGKTRAGAILRVRVTDTATGAEVFEERFARSLPVARPETNAFLALLNRDPAAVDPLASAVGTALRDAVGRVAREVARFPAHVRIAQVRPARLPDQDSPDLGPRPCYVVRLDGGADAGLTAGARLHFRRYQQEGMAGDADPATQILSPPIDTLVVTEVAPGHAEARTTFRSILAEGDEAPRPGDLVRSGDHAVSRGVIASILAQPPNDRRAQGLARILASHVEDNLQDVFERAWKSAGLSRPPRDKLDLSGKVSRRPDGTYACEVTVEGQLLGKTYRMKLPVALPGNPQRPGVTAQEVWSRLAAQLPEAAGPGEQGTQIAAGRPDPGLLKVLRGSPDEDFRRQPDDLPLVARLTPSQPIYRTGQTVRLEVESPKADAYVKVFSIDAVTRRSFQLWPRQLENPGMDARVRDDPAAGLVRQGGAPTEIEIRMAEPAGSFYLAVVGLRKHPKSEEAYRKLTGVIQVAYPPEEDEVKVAAPEPEIVTLVASRGPRPFLKRLQDEVDRGNPSDDDLGWANVHAATVIRCELLSAEK